MRSNILNFSPALLFVLCILAMCAPGYTHAQNLWAYDGSASFAWSECTNRAQYALQSEGFSGIQAPPAQGDSLTVFITGNHASYRVYIMCRPAGQTASTFTIVVASNFGGVQELTNRLAQFLYQPTSAATQMPSPAPVGDLLGRQWIESEKGFRGTWTRRGASNVFDAVWEGGYQAVLTMTLIGNNVRIDRQGADATCRYDGTIVGNQASGQYTCTSFSGIGTWAAEIR